ncbi:hypothetical protein C8R45DRAFT_932196 [Mycena sanguinolenta]|nr:hypothetical protein C8R45DRAFT_932196 [Mycena sanguinolenta]
MWKDLRKMWTDDPYLPFPNIARETGTLLKIHGTGTQLPLKQPPKASKCSNTSGECRTDGALHSQTQEIIRVVKYESIKNQMKHISPTHAWIDSMSSIESSTATEAGKSSTVLSEVITKFAQTRSELGTAGNLMSALASSCQLVTN